MSFLYYPYVLTYYAQDPYGNYYPIATETYLVPYTHPQISSVPNEPVSDNLENTPSVTINVHICKSPQVSIDPRIESSCNKICGISLEELRQKVYDISASVFTFFNSQFDYDLNDDSLSPPLEIVWDRIKSAWIGKNIIGEKEECIFPSTDLFGTLPEIIAHESMHRILARLRFFSHEGQAGALYIHLADVMTLAFKYLNDQKTNFDWKVANRDFTERVHMKSYEPDHKNTLVSNNSRIPNHVFYRLVVDSNNMISIVHIWLTALKNLKSSNATFGNFAKETIIAAPKNSHLRQKIYITWKVVGVKPKVIALVTPTP